MIKVVVFDMDGVLIDAREWHYQALNEALEIFGIHINLQEHLENFDGLPTRVKLDKLVEQGRLPERLKSTISAIKQERTLRYAAQLCYPNIQHILALSELKRQGLKIAVATNSIRASALSMLKFAGVLDLLDLLLTNEDVAEAKPNPEIYLKALEAFHVKGSEALVFEDNLNGIAAAISAGCHVAKVSDPSQINADFVLRNLEKLS